MIELMLEFPSRWDNTTIFMQSNPPHIHLLSFYKMARVNSATTSLLVVLVKGCNRGASLCIGARKVICSLAPIKSLFISNDVVFTVI